MMEIVLEPRISEAIAGAMLLALPVAELLFGEWARSALYDAAPIIAGALLLAAAAVFMRAGRHS